VLRAIRVLNNFAVDAMVDRQSVLLTVDADGNALPATWNCLKRGGLLPLCALRRFRSPEESLSSTLLITRCPLPKLNSAMLLTDRPCHPLVGITASFCRGWFLDAFCSAPAPRLKCCYVTSYTTCMILIKATMAMLKDVRFVPVVQAVFAEL